MKTTNENSRSLSLTNKGKNGMQKSFIEMTRKIKMSSAVQQSVEVKGLFGLNVSNSISNPICNRICEHIFIFFPSDEWKLWIVFKFSGPIDPPKIRFHCVNTDFSHINHGSCVYAYRTVVAHHFYHQTVKPKYITIILTDGYDSCVHVLCIFSCQTINGTELLIE